MNDRLRTKFKVAKTKNWPLLSASSFGPVQIGGPLIYELLVASCCFFVVKVQSFFHIKSSTVFITDNLTRDDELYVAEHQVLSSQIGVAAVVYNGLLSTFVCCLFVFCCCFSVLAGVFYELTDRFFYFLMSELPHCTRE